MQTRPRLLEWTVYLAAFTLFAPRTPEPSRFAFSCPRLESGSSPIKSCFRCPHAPRTGSVTRVAGRPFCTRANLRLGGALMQNGEPGMYELLPIITAVALTCATAPVSWAQSGEVHSAAMMQQRSAALAHSYLQT